MSESASPDPHRLVEHADYRELATREVRVSFPADDLEVFGVLLGEKLTVLGEGHSERDVDGDRLMSANVPEGWTAVLVVHGAATGHVKRVTARVLVPPAVEVDSSACISGLVRIVRGAAKEAREKPLRRYWWTSVLAPRGPDSALEPRARLALAGRYEWGDLSLEPLTAPYEGTQPVGWGGFRPYVEHGSRVSGRLEAPMTAIAQRAAEGEVRRVSLLLSLIFRTAIEPRQQVASVVWGTRDDLVRLYPPPDVEAAWGGYVSADEAFAQRAAELPDEESDKRFRMPRDAPHLWRGIQALNAPTRDRAWNALAAYATAWKLKAEHPSLSLVSLVTAIEALIDAAELQRCVKCDGLRGIGAAYRKKIVRYTGVAEDQLKKFTDMTYDRRSGTLHRGVLFGGEDEPLVAFGSIWTVSASWAFVLREWPLLETLTAWTLQSWLREQVAGAEGQQHGARATKTTPPPGAS